MIVSVLLPSLVTSKSDTGQDSFRWEKDKHQCVQVKTKDQKWKTTGTLKISDNFREKHLWNISKVILWRQLCKWHNKYKHHDKKIQVRRYRLRIFPGNILKKLYEPSTNLWEEKISSVYNCKEWKAVERRGLDMKKKRVGKWGIK